MPTLQGTVKELCNYKVLRVGQNLHANMEGFCRASHIYNSINMNPLRDRLAYYNKYITEVSSLGVHVPFRK